ncbi:MAG: hypothetical protein AB7D01_03600 [Methanoculleus sp.]
MIMKPCPNLHSATLAELVAWYNEHSGKDPIKAFRNRAQAQERCTALLIGQEEPEETEAAHSELAAQLEAANKPATAKRDPDGPELVHLKQLCFDLDLEPRIARRRLRKALGNIGTGQRWAWEPDSPELAKVRAVLAGTPATDEE